MSREPLSALVRWAIGLELVLGVGAVGGGVALMAGPRGEILPLPVAALAGSPFGDYFVPGLILAAILGVGPLVAAAFAWRRRPAAPVLALAAGGALIIWIVVEIEMVGYSNRPPLQAAYLGLGGVMTAVAAVWLRRTASARRRAW